MDQDPAQSPPPAPPPPGAGPDPVPPAPTSQEGTSPDKTQPPVRDLLTWKSPSRPPIVLNREMFTTATALCILLSVIVAFFQEWFLIFLIWGALFLIVTLSKYSPEEVEHRITTQGITSIGKVYLFENLGPFWFSKKGEHKLLHVVQLGYFLGTLLIVLPQNLPSELVRDTLAKYLPFIEAPEKSRTDRFTEWFMEKLANKPKASASEPEITVASPPQSPTSGAGPAPGSLKW